MRKISPCNKSKYDEKEVTKDEFIEDLKCFTNSQRTEYGGLSCMDRISYSFRANLRVKNDLVCDCEACLMMCEPHSGAKVWQPDRTDERIDVDDPWMLHFGCDATRKFK